MLSHAPRGKSQGGYTLLEMLIVVAIIIIGSAVTIPITMQMVRNAKGDSAAVMTATFLESARNRAVAERRNVELTVLSTTSMQFQRIEVPSGTRTVVATLVLEGEEEFMAVALPDTPDLFGGTAAINFTGAPPVMFTSDGSLIDSAGDVVNGTIYIAKPRGNLDTARAVTISGVTGMLRAWKWRGSKWMQ
jgi:prepilin-type N-terminal cleavage/methylation domain-containing protein